MNTLKVFLATLNMGSTGKSLDVSSIYDIKINKLNNTPLDLSKFKGKYILFVNVASKCGFTPQYKELQKLYEKYHDKLEIIGVPCNQFGNQEPDNNQTIASFCELNYGVKFTITEKINVKGKDKHALYNWLTEKINNGTKSSSVKWNFQKYLVNPQGQLVDYFLSTTSPTSFKITKHFK